MLTEYGESEIEIDFGRAGAGWPRIFDGGMVSSGVGALLLWETDKAMDSSIASPPAFATGAIAPTCCMK